MRKRRGGASSRPRALRRADILSMHRQMVRIREFEERAAALLEAGEIRCPTHLYTGQEAVAVGVCHALMTEDYVLGNHRSHGHYLAKGGNLRALMAELYCRIDGCSKGRGGSMHIIATEVGFLGTVPMVGATIPVAVGAALASSLRRERRVSVAFFGDSATEEGVFHEALNFAALHKLPVLFVCENNRFSSHLPFERRRSFNQLFGLAAAYGIPSHRVDGNDVAAVHAAAQAAVARARRGAGPTFLECMTYRWRGHVGPSFDLDVGIRTKAELDRWMKKDPILRIERHLRSVGVASEAIEATWAEARREVDEAIDFARRSPEPDAREVLQHVFMRPEGSA